MNNLSFMWQYLTKPRTTGAILPSSSYLAKKMVENIDFANAQFVVEYGPGTGAFTDHILKIRSADTVLLLIEKNGEFCSWLNDKYSHEPNLYIINDSAENIAKHLAAHDAKHADYIVSGLPFTSLPQDVSTKILAQTKKYLKPGGRFITFQYTLVKKKNFMLHFENIEITREIRNIPTAYVLSCY